VLRLKVENERDQKSNRPGGRSIRSWSAALLHIAVAFLEVGQRTRDYLDWYRISNASQVSENFRSYQELKRELETETTANPGPLDRYLSGMQRLYDQ
jgi:hypothetical protein